MSSSRESMNSLQNELRQSRVDLGLDSQGDQVATTEAPAFYRILFGHQDKVAVREHKIRLAERVVIGEGMRGDSEPHLRQLSEEAIGVADSGGRVKALPREVRDREPRRFVADPVEARRRESHRERASSRRPAVLHRRVHAATAGLAQRPGGEEEAVAQAPLVLHRDLEVALQPIVLQPVVAENDVALGAGGAEGASSRDPVGAYPYRAPAPLG